MDATPKIELIRHAMGAAHIFSSTINELLERTLSTATGEELAMSQVKLLLLIARPNHKFKVTDVAQFLGVTNAAASRSIDRLVQRGLVERVVEPADRRAVDLKTTPASRELLARFAEARDRELERLLGEVPEEKLVTVARLMDELSVALLDLEDATKSRCLRCGVHFRSGCVLRDVVGRECAVSQGLYGDRRGGEHEHDESETELAAFGGP